MAIPRGFKLLFFVLLSCNAQLSSHELRQVEYQVDNEKTNVDIVKEAPSTENDSSQNIPKGNDIEEPFKKETAHCLGCVINVPIDQPRVTEMAEQAVSAMDQIVTAPTIHATPKVLGVQKQVVNGIQYYIQLEVTLSDCPQSTSSTRDQCKPLPDSPTVICEVSFLDQPWNNPKPQLMANNCTDANSDNDVENYTPDDLLAVERSSGVENTFPTQDVADTTTEEKQEATTLASDELSADENRNGRKVNGGTGMMKAMDSSEIDLINELADIAVRTLNELDVGGSRKEVLDIIDAKKQIVNGLMYHLVLRIGSKSCVDEADCQTEERASQSICNVQLHRSWAGDTPYKAKVVKSECEEAWEENREGRQLSTDWVSQDMYDPEYTDCIKAVLSKAYNVVPKEKVTLTGLLRQDAGPKSTDIIAELKLDSDKWAIPKPGKKEVLILRPKVSCNSDVDKSSVKAEKERMPGAPMQADLNDKFINAIADFALEELDKGSNSPNKRMIVRLIEANTQIVAGKSVTVKMELIPSDCPKGMPSSNECSPEKGQDSEICTVVVLDQAWVPARKLERSECAQSTEIPRPQDLVGGFSDADKDSPEVQAAVDFAVGELNRISNSMYRLNAVGVLEARRQLVSGILYHLKLAVLPTSCKKDEQTTSNCELSTEATRQECSLQVWSQPWVNKMSLETVHCVDSAREKRSARAESQMSFGGLTPADSNSPGVQDAVNFAVKELDKSSNSIYKQKAVEVIEAHHQVVAGSLYHLKLKLVDTNCKKTDPDTANCQPQPNVDGQICSLKVWSRSWLNEVSLQDVSCGPARAKRSVGQNIAGGITDADQNSPEIQGAIEFALTELDKITNSVYKQKVVEVVEAKRQTVAGTLYHLKLKLSDSNCKKSDQTSATQCETLPNVDGQICSVKVWSRPWLNETKVTEVNCAPNRAKRSLGGNKPGGIKAVDKNSPGVRAAVEFAVREMDRNTNSIYKQRAVEVIEANHQVVAGSLYHLKLRVVETNCKKDDLATTACEQQPNVDGQVCSLKVWSRPWINEMTLKDVECAPARAKRSLGGATIPGGLSDADKNSPEVKSAVDFAVKELDKSSNSIYKQTPVEVIEAQQQVVAGVLYHLKIRVADSNCRKDDQAAAGCQQQPNSVGQICSLKVWSRPWLNSMEVSDVSCAPAPTRAKRSLDTLGSGHDANRNSNAVKAASNFAVEQWEKTTNCVYKHRVVEVVEAKEQLVGGISYSLKLKVEATSCRKGDPLALTCDRLQSEPIHLCTASVWSKPWRGEMSLRSIECQSTGPETSQDTNIGGMSSIEDVLDPYIKDLAEYSRDEIDKATNSMHAQKVVRVLEARKQVVSGILVHLKLELVRTACTKGTKDRSNCEALPNQKSQVCEVMVWDRPWMQRRKIRDLKCADAHIISSPEQPDGVTIMFSAFVDQFKKTYQNEAEMLRRFEIFKENLNTIKELQDTERGTATYGPTMFADLTHDEFKKHYLGLRPDMQQENSVEFPKAEIPKIQLPKEFDWRDHNAVTPVKNQGMCGSCWAFAVTGDIEGQYAIKYKKLLSFSEQELVDCDKLDNGCQGGLPDSAYRALEQLGGLELEQDYPYDGHGQSCSLNKTLTRVHVHGAVNISSNETDMAKWLVQNGPIAIGINANAMQFYMGGVSHPLKFLCNPGNLDHGVLIVGFGEHSYPVFKKTLPFWVIKNSWGAKWGEQGYYRVYRGDGSCGVNTMASSAIIE